MKSTLLQELSIHIKLNKSRIITLISMIASLLCGNGIQIKELSLCIESSIKRKSKEHRVYRFFKEVEFDYLQVSSFILNIFGSKKFIFAIDRTNWKFGNSDINILFLAIVIGKISVPVYWSCLPHGGGCSAKFMEDFFKRFIDKFGSKKIEYLLADREFMNKKWLGFLIKNKINFITPLKCDHKIRKENELVIINSPKVFDHLQALEISNCKGYLWGRKLTLVGHKNEKGELKILASNFKCESEAFVLYRARWSIERLFKHMKTSGFDIDSSHIVKTDRFEKLLVVVSIAAAIIIKSGIIENSITPIPIKGKNTSSPKPLFSLFTYGFDWIKNIFQSSKQLFYQCINSICKPPDKTFKFALGNCL